MALYRAMESVRPARKRLFRDPFAIQFLKPSLRTVVGLCYVPFLAAALAWYADRQAPGARTSAIARTCLIDDVVSQGLADGIEQIVILGAGFDCRLYRLAGVGRVTGFEVDQPATQATKVSRLRRVLRTLPANVRYVAIDFDRQSLAEALASNGFDHGLRTMFLWEGVTNYLSADAVDAVLRYVAGCGSGTRAVFTYVHRGAIDGSGDFADASGILRRVAELGERWTFGILPEELRDYLKRVGLKLEWDFGAAQYRRQYFGKGAESMSGYDFYHVALATVAGRRMVETSCE
jgi:methyltransferase (TIGR00027 family)